MIDTKEREAFEAIHCGNNPHLTRKNSTTDDYVLPSINDAWAGWQAARQSQAAELAKSQEKVAELSTHPCLLEDGNFDHDWKFVDDSFDHEFGTETVHYYECKCCNATKDCEGDDE